jgi:hypothetical protein
LWRIQIMKLLMQFSHTDRNVCGIGLWSTIWWNEVGFCRPILSLRKFNCCFSRISKPYLYLIVQYFLKCNLNAQLLFFSRLPDKLFWKLNSSPHSDKEKADANVRNRCSEDASWNQLWMTYLRVVSWKVLPTARNLRKIDLVVDNVSWK